MNTKRTKGLFDECKKYGVCKRCKKPSKTQYCELCTLYKRVYTLELLVKRVLIPMADTDPKIEKFCKDILNRSSIPKGRPKRGGY